MFADLLDMVVGLILPAFGFNFDTFARSFPFAATAYGIFQKVALALALLITGWHLVPFLMTWFGIQTNQLKSTPLRQLFQCALAVIMIYYGNYLLNGIINIAQYPFDALLNANADPSWSIFQFDIGIIISALNDLFYNTSPLLYLILLLLIGFNLIKVLLEAVERYVVLFILIYLSPLAACTLASEETSGIYKRFFTMFMSQCLLLLLNVWTMKMAISMFSSLGANNLPILGLLMGYSFLRIALRMDSYVNQLGLNAAVTGAGLGMELMAAGVSMLSGSEKSGSAGSASSTAGVAGSPVLGAAKSVSGIMQRWNPVSMLGNYAGATLEGIGASAQTAVTTGKNILKTSGKVGHAISSGVNAGVGSIGQNISERVMGIDNMFSRHVANRKSSAAALESIQSGTASTVSNGSHYDKSQKLAANNAYSAGQILAGFESEGYETSEPKSISAVLEGTGARNANPALKNFINVGNGTDDTITPGSAQFKMDSQGIHASYTKGKSNEHLELRTETQYANLNPNEQKTYQQFKSKSGDTYYYQLSSKPNITKRKKPDEQKDPPNPDDPT